MWPDQEHPQEGLCIWVKNQEKTSVKTRLDFAKKTCKKDLTVLEQLAPGLKCTTSSLKHGGGSVIVWTCIAA